MPRWGILKTAKNKRASAHKVRFNMKDHDPDGCSGSSCVHSDGSDSGCVRSDGSDSGCVHSDASDNEQQLQDLGHHPCCQGHERLPDLSHNDVEDEEERRCLKHLDHLGLALESTFKNVDSIDAFVRKLRVDFDHDVVSEKRFMSCMCSAKIARAACCKKQIEVWQRLQHDIQECCCHHHHHHQQEEEEEAVSQVCEPRREEPPEQALDSDSSSISTVGSQDTGDVDFIMSQLSKMALFNLVRQRLDPSADIRSFVEHWILQGLPPDAEPHSCAGD